jgi:hypothetical protein
MDEGRNRTILTAASILVSGKVAECGPKVFRARSRDVGCDLSRGTDYAKDRLTLGKTAQPL